MKLATRIFLVVAAEDGFWRGIDAADLTLAPPIGHVTFVGAVLASVGGFVAVHAPVGECQGKLHWAALKLVERGAVYYGFIDHQIHETFEFQTPVVCNDVGLDLGTLLRKGRDCVGIYAIKGSMVTPRLKSFFNRDGSMDGRWCTAGHYGQSGANRCQKNSASW